jgi:hypothetical protein
MSTILFCLVSGLAKIYFFLFKKTINENNNVYVIFYNKNFVFNYLKFKENARPQINGGLVRATNYKVLC